MNRTEGMAPEWQHLLGAETRRGGSVPESRNVKAATEGPHASTRVEKVGQAVAGFWGPVVLLDLVMGFSLMFVTTALPGGLVGGLATGVVMVAVSACRRAKLTVPGGGLLVIAFLALMAFLVLVSVSHGMPWQQRLLKFFILFAVCVVIATGRIDIRSFVIGACMSACANVLLFYAGLTENNYPPYLTGFYGDKNVAGMYYAIWGILGLAVLSPRWRIPWFFLSTWFVFLTGSRTALGGIVLAALWVLLRNRIGVAYRIALAAIGYAVLVFSINNYASSSAFGDRTGTDWYRAQIDQAMEIKASLTPWTGLGLNQGFVVIGDRRQWFHDSYLQAFVEGGHVFLWSTVLAFVLLGLGLLDRRLHVSWEMLTAEATVIVVLVCAWKLGEVFMTVGAFIVLGICIAYRLGKPAAASNLAWRAAEIAPPRASNAAPLHRGAPVGASRSEVQA